MDISKTVSSALVVGATGIAGAAIVEYLVQRDVSVTALSRSGGGTRHALVTPIMADLCAPVEELSVQLSKISPPSHVFFVCWLKQDTEEENIEVNAGMLQRLLNSIDKSTLKHVALLTGTKHYLGPFEAYGKPGTPDTPFRENVARLPYPNFYYAQEDVLARESAKMGFTWSVHRAHTIIGFCVGNAMNMASTLAVYASICKETALPFVFPGSQQMWNGLTNVTDASFCAEHMVWAASLGRTEAFNCVNGDVFRYSQLPSSPIFRLTGSL